MQPTDEQLLKWRTSTEDHSIERKTFGDVEDWVKTVVASDPLQALSNIGKVYDRAVPIRLSGGEQLRLLC